jgi:hypothetical protein
MLTRQVGSFSDASVKRGSIFNLSGGVFFCGLSCTEWDICGNVDKKNSVVLVRKRTIPTKRPQPADEVSANFSW